MKKQTLLATVAITAIFAATGAFAGTLTTADGQPVATESGVVGVAAPEGATEAAPVKKAKKAKKSDKKAKKHKKKAKKAAEAAPAEAQ